MNNYEVVCVIDGGISSDKIDFLKQDVNNLLSDNGHIIEIDDIGILDTVEDAYKKERMYYYSVYYKSDGNSIQEMKKELSIKKGINRSFFYKMHPNEKFLLYNDVVERVESYLSENTAEDDPDIDNNEQK